MTILLRLIAVFAFISVALTVWLVVILADGGGLRQLSGTGALGWMTVIGWLITFTAGPVAAVQLWRLRESGRRAAILLFACTIDRTSAAGDLTPSPMA
jgi:hypothetical protein